MHEPATQVAVTPQAMQAAPRVPHADPELPVWQRPLESQQPVAHELTEQRGAVPHDAKVASAPTQASEAKRFRRRIVWRLGGLVDRLKPPRSSGYWQLPLGRHWPEAHMARPPLLQFGRQ